MKYGGTLKVEIIKPLDGVTWDALGARLRELAGALPLALNFTLRDVFPSASKMLEAIVDDERSEASSHKKKVVEGVRKRLRFHWTRQLERRQRYVTEKAPKGRRSKERSPLDPSTFAAVSDTLCSETSDHILASFAGQHLKDMIAGRRSLPESLGAHKAFYSEGRRCELAGDADSASIEFPLWMRGQGPNGVGAVRFAVAPCGGSARAIWNELVKAATEPRRQEIIDIVARAKKKDATAVAELEEMRALKVGRVGIVYNERKRKWFITLAWTRYEADIVAGGKAAACNFGVNAFIVALSEDGTEPYVDVAGLPAPESIATRAFRRETSEQAEIARLRGELAESERLRKLAEKRLAVAEKELAKLRQRIAGKGKRAA